MSETERPQPTNRGISFSMSVVLPLPDQPAKPKIFMGRNLYQEHLATGERQHDGEDPAHQRIGEAPAAVLGAK